MNKNQKKELVDNIFLVAIVFAIMIVIYIVQRYDLLLQPKTLNLILFIPFLCVLFPYLFYISFLDKGIKKKMSEIPRFLRDITDKFIAGSDLVSSITSLNIDDYFYLRDNIKRFQNSIKWGVTFEEAFVKFTKDLKSENFTEEIRLILEAKKIGGNVDILLLELSKKIEKDNKRGEEKKIGLYETNFTGYISFILFLSMIVILYNTLFLELSNVGLTDTGFESTDGEPKEEIRFILSLFIILSYELSVLSGFIFGFMQETKFSAGALHISALSTVSFLIFLVFI